MATFYKPLRGIINLDYMEDLLGGQAPQLPGPSSGFSPSVELQLIALTFSQRDAEVLVHGYIPPFCVKHRFEVEFSLSDLPLS